MVQDEAESALSEQNEHLLPRPWPTDAVTTRAGLTAAASESGNGALSQSRVHISPFTCASSIKCLSLTCTPRKMSTLHETEQHDEEQHTHHLAHLGHLVTHT